MLLPLFLQIIAVSSQSYDHSIGNEAYYYAFGAFCDESIIQTWTNGLAVGPSSVRQFELYDIITPPEGTLQAFIGYDTANTRIILSFRGSDNVDNWVDTNIDLWLDRYPYAPSGSLHGGFYDAFKELEEAGLTQMIHDMINDRPTYKTVLVTGHSLGGALAAIGGLELKRSPLYSDLNLDKVEVISFGSPRWCTPSLAELFNDVIDTKWRIVNRYDMAVTVPTKKMGFHHVGTQIWYRWQRWWWQEDPISFKKCNGSGEDPDCFGTDFWLDRIAMVHHHSNYFALDNRGMCVKSN